MIIKLSNGYYIEIDNLNHTLKQNYIGTTKDGEKKEYEKTIGYFSNLDNALKRYLIHNQTDFMADSSMSLDEYLEFVEEANKQAIKEIKSLLEGGE